VEWATGVHHAGSCDREAELLELGARQPVDVVLMETGRLRKNSAIWKMEATKVVVSFEGWREAPPQEWNTCRKNLKHDQLGGLLKESSLYASRTEESLRGSRSPTALLEHLRCSGTF
jgi:hypothetical protein